MSEKTSIQIALEPKAAVPLSVLKFWKDLAVLDPARLQQKMGEQIARLEVTENSKAQDMQPA